MFLVFFKNSFLTVNPYFILIYTYLKIFTYAYVFKNILLIWLLIKFHDELHLQIIEQVYLPLWNLENI